MSKRIIQIISILFLLSLFTISCSNQDKTGSSNSSGENDITQYAGDWNMVDSNQEQNIKGSFSISSSGTIKYQGIDVPVVKNQDGTYTITVKGEITINITFNFNDLTYVTKDSSNNQTDNGKIKKA